MVGIRFVNVRVGDILISDRPDGDHLDNLDKVTERFSEAGLRVNLSKCSFLQPKVTYCGYRGNKEGVQPLLGNVDAVRKAPEPTNVSELRSYLGW